MTNKYIETFKDNCKKLEEDMLFLNKQDDNIKTNTFDEMATVYGKDTTFWFSVAVYSNDHKPAHMHILTKESEHLVFKVEITENKPNSIEDLKCFDWKIPETNAVKKEILKWSRSKNKRGINYWDLALTTWDMLHPND